jgi:hypothetical protein
VQNSDVISIIAVIFSVAASVLSVVSARRDSTVVTYNSTTDLTLQVDRLFIDFPHLRPYFYDNVPVPADSGDRNQVLAAAEFFLDVLECIWDRKSEYSRKDVAAWQRWILDLFDTAPVLRTYFVETSTWYPTLLDLHTQAGSTWWLDNDPPMPSPRQG